MVRRLPPTRVVSEAEAEQVDYVVCMRKEDDPGTFTDNLVGLCSHCGHAIIFRPRGVPKTPPKICVECVTLVAAATRQ